MNRELEAESRLAVALKGGRLALTAECLPPRSADAEAIKQVGASLPDCLDAVVVSEGGAEVRVCALAAAVVLAREGRQPVLGLAARDRNRIALSADVLGAAALGVVNFLCYSGEHQALGACPEAAGVFDVDSVQMLMTIKQLRDESPATLPGVLLGALAHPGLKPMQFSVVDLRKKIAAGAQFVVTDPVFDIAAFTEWMKGVRDAGLHEQCHIIAGVKPLESAAQAEAIRARQPGVGIADEVLARLANAEQPAQEGIAICVELADQVRRVEGIRGIHIACGGHEEAAAAVIERASLNQR